MRLFFDALLHLHQGSFKPRSSVLVCSVSCDRSQRLRVGRVGWGVQTGNLWPTHPDPIQLHLTAPCTSISSFRPRPHLFRPQPPASFSYLPEGSPPNSSKQTCPAEALANRTNRIHQAISICHKWITTILQIIDRTQKRSIYPTSEVPWRMDSFGLLRSSMVFNSTTGLGTFVTGYCLGAPSAWMPDRRKATENAAALFIASVSCPVTLQYAGNRLKHCDKPVPLFATLQTVKENHDPMTLWPYDILCNCNATVSLIMFDWTQQRSAKVRQRETAASVAYGWRFRLNDPRIRSWATTATEFGAMNIVKSTLCANLQPYIYMIIQNTYIIYIIIYISMHRVHSCTMHSMLRDKHYTSLYNLIPKGGWFTHAAEACRNSSTNTFRLVSVYVSMKFYVRYIDVYRMKSCVINQIDSFKGLAKHAGYLAQAFLNPCRLDCYAGYAKCI